MAMRYFMGIPAELLLSQAPRFQVHPIYDGDSDLHDWLWDCDRKKRRPVMAALMAVACTNRPLRIIKKHAPYGHWRQADLGRLKRF
jgi:hypothetical protein